MALTSDFIRSYDPTPRKGFLKSYLIFGATGDIGGNAAKAIQAAAPDALLRLVTSREDAADSLQQKFPNAEVVVANYTDFPSMDRAFKGIEGALIVIPDYTDEWVAMGNVVQACKKWGCIKHIIRIIGEAPGMHLELVPDIIRRRPQPWGGPILGHPTARDILTRAELPVTYLNMAAWMMKSLLNEGIFKPCIEKLQNFCFPYDHPITYIDSREVGEVAGNILASDDHRHINHTYCLENGHDWITGKELAAMISEEFDIELGFVGDDLDEYERVTAGHPIKRYGILMMEYSAYEMDFANRFYLSNTLEQLLGRKPITMREWLKEHKGQFDLSVYDK